MNLTIKYAAAFQMKESYSKAKILAISRPLGSIWKL